MNFRKILGVFVFLTILIITSFAGNLRVDLDCSDYQIVQKDGRDVVSFNEGRDVILKDGYP